MAHDSAPPRSPASRLRAITRAASALVLLLGGLIALLGWIATTGDRAWDVIGVLLLLIALVPTLIGLGGLFAARRRDGAR